MEMKNLRQKINEKAKQEGLDIVERSSTVSWLYPGQFAYCLNEEFIWDRFGSFIDIPESIHFHKIQPVIRWDDFIRHFQGSSSIPVERDGSHLESFDMTTITGGHIVSRQEHERYSREAFKGIIEFLTSFGLRKENFEITFFPGARLSEIGKGRNGFQKYAFEFEFPEDREAKESFLEVGLQESQIKPDSSRNCFLIPNWICGEVAPWGYRNEINYKTSQGLVDIATIERLSLRPIRQENEIVGVEDWDKVFVISGTGLERLSMIENGLNKIQDVDNIKPLYDFVSSRGYENPDLICESVRIAGRLIADTGGNMIDKKSPKTADERKKKYNRVLRNLCSIDDNGLLEMFRINAEINPWYPELRSSIGAVLEQIKSYRERSNMRK